MKNGKMTERVIGGFNTAVFESALHTARALSLLQGHALSLLKGLASAFLSQVVPNG